MKTYVVRFRSLISKTQDERFEQFQARDVKDLYYQLVRMKSRYEAVEDVLFVGSKYRLKNVASLWRRIALANETVAV